MDERNTRIKITSKWLKQFEHDRIALLRQIRKYDTKSRQFKLMRARLKAFESQIKDLRKDLYDLQNE